MFRLLFAMGLKDLPSQEGLQLATGWMSQFNSGVMYQDTPQVLTDLDSCSPISFIGNIVDILIP